MFCETNQSSQVIESEPKVRKRTASKEKTTKTAKGTNIIRLPISELKYLETVKDPICFRQWLNGEYCGEIGSSSILVKSYFS